MNIPCPICEARIQVPDQVKKGERITCPNCFAQLGAHKQRGKIILACAFCKEPVFDPVNCDECERRHEKRKILEEGRL